MFDYNHYQVITIEYKRAAIGSSFQLSNSTDITILVNSNVDKSEGNNASLWQQLFESTKKYYILLSCLRDTLRHALCKGGSGACPPPPRKKN